MPKFKSREEYLAWKENKAKQKKKTTFKDIYKDLTKTDKFAIVLFTILFIFTFRYEIIPRYKTWVRRQVTEELKKTEKVEKKVKKKSKKVSVDKHDVHGAWAYMQLFVKEDLKSPQSADFPFGGYRHVTYLGNKRYKVGSYVDSQNSFGGMIRTNFQGIITRINNGWKLEYLHFE